MDIRNFAEAEIKKLFCKHYNGTSLRRFIGQRCQLRPVRQILSRNPGSSEKLGRHAVAHGDGPGFVQQQNIHVARGLDGPAACRYHIVAQQPVHSADADGA